MPQGKSCFLTVNGLSLRYLDWGGPGGPPLVCVHGFTSSAESFNALARHFRDRFRIIVVDVRGHGESAWSPTGAYEYSDQAADLEGIVDQLGLERFTLIGTSMGGIIAMTYAGAHHERLTRLVINDVGPDAETGSQRITQMVAAQPDDFASLEEAMEYRRQGQPLLALRSEEDQMEQALGRLRQGSDGRWVWKMDPEYARQRRDRGGPPQRPPLWPVLEHLPCPTLVVWGMESDILSERQAHRMVEVLPLGRLVAVPGVGHPPTLMEPVVMAALENFLTDPE